MYTYMYIYTKIYVSSHTHTVTHIITHNHTHKNARTYMFIQYIYIRYYVVILAVKLAYIVMKF